MTRERWMGLSFAIGSLCFVVGPFPGYAELVGAEADAITFFVGSIFFTAGGALQTSLAWHEPGSDAWWTAVVQSVGTLCFNVSTYLALHTSISNADYDRLVWRPDAVGSVCFLVSGVICYRARQPGDGWEPLVNLLGCVLFGISAVAGYVVPSHGDVIDLAAANWNTALGAACFLACGVAAFASGRTAKSPRLRRLRHLEEEVERDVRRLV